MKKIIWFVLMSMVILSFEVNAKESKIFNVYTDQKSLDNHYIPSGYMGDYSDIKANEGYTSNPHSGLTCIRFVYTAKRAQGQGWAGVYWQNPENNWGEVKGGFNLSQMNKLSFWARGGKGGEKIEQFKVGGIKGNYSDSAEVGIGPIELTSEWKQYTINLASKDLSYISGGFCWATTAELNPNGAIFYLDDIKFEFDLDIKPEVKLPEKMPFYIYKDSRFLGNHYSPSGWMGDYGDINFDGAWIVNYHSEKSCIKIVYSNKASQGARWAGIYWQNPPNNWGNLEGGYDLSEAKRLVFWTRGESGGERIEEIKVGGISGEYADSDAASIGPIELTKEWQKFTIDLTEKDLSHIIGGFCWATNLDVNPDGCVFYLDDIYYE